MTSQNYSWEHKKIKLFIFSTTEYKRGKSVSLKRTELDEDEKNFDIDVLYIKRGIKELCKHSGVDIDEDEHIDISKDKFIQKFNDMEKDTSLCAYACDYDCYFFMFFTFLAGQGEGQDMLVFKGGSMSLHDIWDIVKRMPHFHGKPKVFLIQTDDLSLLYEPVKDKDTPIPPKIIERKIPIDADRLIIESKIPQAIRNNGCSFLVQSFIDIVIENRKKPLDERLDLLSLTTEINRQVKEKIEIVEIQREKNQLSNLPYPLVNSTFTQFLYL